MPRHPHLAPGAGALDQRRRRQVARPGRGRASDRLRAPRRHPLRPPPYPSLALGTADISTIEMAAAYAAIANGNLGGAVHDRQGDLVERPDSRAAHAGHRHGHRSARRLRPHPHDGGGVDRDGRLGARLPIALAGKTASSTTTPTPVRRLLAALRRPHLGGLRREALPRPRHDRLAGGAADLARRRGSGARGRLAARGRRVTPPPGVGFGTCRILHGAAAGRRRGGGRFRAARSTRPSCAAPNRCRRRRRAPPWCSVFLVSAAPVLHPQGGGEHGVAPDARGRGGRRGGGRRGSGRRGAADRRRESTATDDHLPPPRRLAVAARRA